MQSRQSRRRLLATLSSAAGVSLIGSPNVFAQQAPPETTTVRIAKIAGICIAPQYVADELLRAEGFTDIRYVAVDAGIPASLLLARGEVDFTANYAPTFIIPIDAGEPITIVGGEHLGFSSSLRRKASEASRISGARTSACKVWVQANTRF
jgi:NitT/TauT family transport system substrate-binding protein